MFLQVSQINVFAGACRTNKLLFLVCSTSDLLCMLQQVLVLLQ